MSARNTIRAGFDDGGSNSFLIRDTHNVERMPKVLDATVFDEPMMCNRCYGKHVGFTCPTD
jgi:hypothetical protein